jgi:hypothetical protein
MQKRHFEAIANILKAARPTMSNDAHRALVDEFTFMCAAQNPRFQSAQFQSACGVGNDEYEQAVKLSEGNPDYRPRKVRGKWVVWCDASDHEVEF